MLPEDVKYSHVSLKDEDKECLRSNLYKSRDFYKAVKETRRLNIETLCPSGRIQHTDDWTLHSCNDNTYVVT